MWASGDVGMSVGFASLTTTPLPRRTTTTTSHPSSCAPNCGQSSALPSPGAGPLPSPLPTAGEASRLEAPPPGGASLYGWVPIFSTYVLHVHSDGWCWSCPFTEHCSLGPLVTPSITTAAHFHPTAGFRHNYERALACVMWAFLQRTRGPRQCADTCVSFKAPAVRACHLLSMVWSSSSSKKVPHCAKVGIHPGSANFPEPENGSFRCSFSESRHLPRGLAEDGQEDNDTPLGTNCPRSGWRRTGLGRRAWGSCRAKGEDPLPRPAVVLLPGGRVWCQGLAHLSLHTAVATACGTLYFVLRACLWDSALSGVKAPARPPPSNRHKPGAWTQCLHVRGILFFSCCLNSPRVTATLDILEQTSPVHTCTTESAVEVPGYVSFWFWWE